MPGVRIDKLSISGFTFAISISGWSVGVTTVPSNELGNPQGN
jgi:hypothetical protein